MLKLNSVFHHLPSVRSKQLYGPAQLGCNGKEGSSKYKSNPLVNLPTSCLPYLTFQITVVSVKIFFYIRSQLDLFSDIMAEPTSRQKYEIAKIVADTPEERFLEYIKFSWEIFKSATEKINQEAHMLDLLKIKQKKSV